MNNDLLLIAGPCAIEDDSTPLFIAEKVLRICEDLGIKYVFKSSFAKDFPR